MTCPKSDLTTGFTATGWHSTLWRELGLRLIQATGRLATKAEVTAAYKLTRRLVRRHDAEEHLVRLAEQLGMVLELHPPASNEGEYTVVRYAEAEPHAPEVVGRGGTPAAAVINFETTLPQPKDTTTAVDLTGAAQTELDALGAAWGCQLQLRRNLNVGGSPWEVYSSRHGDKTKPKYVAGGEDPMGAVEGTRRWYQRNLSQPIPPLSSKKYPWHEEATKEEDRPSPDTRKALYALIDEKGEIRALQHCSAEEARSWYRQGTITTPTLRLAEIVVARPGDIVGCFGDVSPEGILQAKVLEQATKYLRWKI